MSPGGHLASTALTCGAVYALTGSATLTAGVAAGGFLIDADHAVDYVLFEARRDLRPAAFLRHYAEQRTARLVLVLHSYELLALVALVAWLTNSAWLWGYVLGAALHLPLDIVFNGKVLSRNLLPFYSFAYRWRAGFRSERLIGVTAPRPRPGGFWRSFFAEFFPAPSASRTVPGIRHDGSRNSSRTFPQLFHIRSPRRAARLSSPYRYSLASPLDAAQLALQVFARLAARRGSARPTGPAR